MEELKGGALGQAIRSGAVSHVGSTKRIQALNGLLHGERPNVDISRCRAFTKVYRQTEGEPPMMRRYKASAEVYRQLSDVVYDHEQLFGWPTQRMRGANFAIELHAHWLAEDLPNLRRRSYDPFDISEEDYRELLEEHIPYWKDQTLVSKWSKYISEAEFQRAQTGGVSDVSNYICSNGSHFIPAWTDVLTHGFVKYHKEATQRLAALDPNDPASIDLTVFYRGLIEVAEAIRDWGERLATAIEAKAAGESNAPRKAELIEGAERLRRVPWGPAESFHDAVQVAWCVCFFLFVEGAGPSITWGRFDQYMYPYYKKDVEAGRLTPEGALELIEELYIKATSNVWFQSTNMAYIFGGYYRYPHLDVGGLNEGGQDASNELSYLCLRAMRYAKTTSPAVCLMLHQKTPDDLLYEACELAAEGMGHPSFFNCEGLYAMLSHRASKPGEYSHYSRGQILKFGSPIGCVEPGAEGLQYGHTDSGIINVAGALFCALTNGRKAEGVDGSHCGQLVTYESGQAEEFKTFDAFYAAVKDQIAYAIREAHGNLIICEKLLAEQFNLPTFTMLLDGALARGKDATAGGALQNVGPTMNMSGFGTLVDSVAAIKKLVYEDKSVTLAQVRDACMANFKHQEDLQRQLMAAPKFGNDDDFVDDLAVDLWRHFAQVTSALPLYRAGQYCDAAVQMVQSNVGYGAMTGATPNGRLAGTPLSDTMSASQQGDTRGPTAAARSYGKLDYPLYTNGTLLNMWISRSELID